MPWAGWGAGPAGAGSAGGPGRAFLVIAMLGCLLVAWILYKDAKRAESLIALAAAVYFAMRGFGGLGRRRDDR
jgi:cbb3-type cytochrome oxidase subunit 3